MGSLEHLNDFHILCFEKEVKKKIDFEISLGVIGGNFLGLQPTPWIYYLAGFGGILLTFLAGAVVDTQVQRKLLYRRHFLCGAIFAIIIPAR